MLHIIIKYGMVMGVCELGKTPDDEPTWLELERDYKVENQDQLEEELTDADIPF
jgi:hypothetical protein